MGITPQELQAAGAIVQGYNLPGETIQRILNLDHGAGATLHLSKNPEALYQLSQMSVADAAVYIEMTLKPAAKKFIKSPNTTPPPAGTLKGKGKPDSERGPKGTVYY